MTAFNGYPISILLALTLHGLIVGSLLWMERASTQVLEVSEPPSVQASLVEENPQARNQRIQEQQQQQEQQRLEEQRRQEEERRAQEERERQEEQRRQEEERQAQLQREREQQRREEEERRQEEQRRQEEERRAQEERERQEEQRRQEEAERQRQQEMQAQREAEARRAAETEAEMVGAYTAIIHDLVSERWNRPPSARNEMEAVLRIRLVPTGAVVDVEIVSSSGDAAFDRSAVNAVEAVGRFSELQGMPPRMFERNFRSLLLTFRPEDLRN